MRKPLLLISVICCLLLSSATPLLSSVDRRHSSYDPAGSWDLGSWFISLIASLPLLPVPTYTNIFNDGAFPTGWHRPSVARLAKHLPFGYL